MGRTTNTYTQSRSNSTRVNKLKNIDHKLVTWFFCSPIGVVNRLIIASLHRFESNVLFRSNMYSIASIHLSYCRWLSKCRMILNKVNFLLNEIYELFKKFQASPRKKNHSWIFLLGQHLTISYKTTKTNSDFLLKGVYNKSKIWVPFRTFWTTGLYKFWWNIIRLKWLLLSIIYYQTLCVLVMKLNCIWWVWNNPL